MKTKTKTTKKKTTKTNRNPKAAAALDVTGHVLPNGVALSFSDEAAAPLLQEWANALTANDGSATYAQAIERERIVVHQVRSHASFGSTAALSFFHASHCF